MSRKDTAVIIPAAGKGQRMDAGCNKLLLPLGAKTILERTLLVFQTHPRISHIYLVVAQQDHDVLQPLIEGQEQQITEVTGGKERQDSVYNALMVIQQQPQMPKWILVHDGARPWCSHALIDQVLKQCAQSKAVIPIVPLTDTIRQVSSDQTKVLDRSQLFATQTPQGFQTELLLQAYQQAREEQWQVTDDASLFEKMGMKVDTVPGEIFNLKITTPLDLQWSQWWLSTQHTSRKNDYEN
ncbi:2-C-methyl-D-erythritol 4-phosphate cytidylyltransferase [Deltaproteobacteria bacterium TL4]